MPAILDHIDGDKANNRIANLRAATPYLNSINSAQRRVNDGKPWLDSDVFTLVELMRQGSSVEDSAVFLLRAGTVDDVRALAKELRLI